MPANPPTVQLNLPQHLQSPLINSYNSPVGCTHHAQPQLGQQQQQTVGAPPENRGGYSKEYGNLGNQEAMGRKSESLRKFSGQPGDFINWSEHFMDHMAHVHQVWRPTLVWMSKNEEPPTMHRLRDDTIGPYNENACDLALKLEQTFIVWMPE